MNENLKSGKFIKELRKQTGLTQKQFAKKVGVNQANISAIENNKYDISLSKFYEWCNLLNITDYNKILIN
jgi:transcriptional regulator with XRE-family HTH domain